MNKYGQLHILPPGHRVVQNNVDAEVKAHAFRLGLYSVVSEALQWRSGQRAAAGLQRDGDWLVAIVALAGFKEEKDNPL